MTTLPSRVQYAVYEVATGLIVRAGSASLIDGINAAIGRPSEAVKICEIDSFSELEATDGSHYISDYDSISWYTFT